MQEQNLTTKKILQNNVKITGEESLLIISSEQYRTIATSFYKTAIKNKTSATLIIIPHNSKRSLLPKKSLSPLIKHSDVVFFFLDKPVPFSESSLYPHLASTRFVSFCDINEDLLSRMCKDSMNIFIKKSRKIADIFSIGKNISITTESGTNVNASISRFRGNAVTGKALAAGQYTYIPFGFCSIHTMRGSAEGKIIANGSFTKVGLIKNPVTMHISKGRVNRIFGNDEAIKIREQLRSNPKPFRDIISIGIGTDPYAVFNGHSFEDKCVNGVVFITLGNHDISPSIFSRLYSFDIVLKNTTLKIDSMTLVENGELRV